MVGKVVVVWWWWVQHLITSRVLPKLSLPRCFFCPCLGSELKVSLKSAIGRKGLVSESEKLLLLQQAIIMLP